MAADNIPDRQVKARLLTLDALDGRTLALKRAKEFITGLESDLGGDLSVAKRALVQRAAMLDAFLEDQEARWIKGEQIEHGLYFAAINNQRRCLETLGLERTPKPVADLRAFLVGEPEPTHHAPPEQEDTAS